jgi:hypothetical protein
LYYGECDEWSIAVWQRAAGTGDLTIHRLPGCTHLPTLGGAETLESISPAYTNTLLAWIDKRISH